MKKYFLLLVTILLYSGVYAGQTDTTVTTASKMKRARPARPPVCYLDLSTGIDNAPGIFGLDFNICLAKYVTLDAGAGPSTWGNKLYLGAKYYLKEAHRGWALGGGITYNSGQENEKLRLNTITGDREQVALSLKPQIDAFVAIYRYWNLGKKYNRFFTYAGKSIMLHQPRYHQLYGDPITEQARRNVNMLAPGGFLGGLNIGVGFCFGMYRK